MMPSRVTTMPQGQKNSRLDKVFQGKLLAGLRGREKEFAEDRNMLLNGLSAAL